MNNEEYLQFLREKNKKFMSKCFYCDGFAITISADGYAIYPVCKNHMSDKDVDAVEENINKLFDFI